MARIEEILELERLERDIFRGIIAETTLTRTFGGQVAGQALVSAVRTVDPAYSVHSLHGYFLRPGNPMEPTVFLVDRVRDGRSFATRLVTGIQDGQAIFTMSASFHVQDEGIEHQDEMPPVLTPRPWRSPRIRKIPRLRGWLASGPIGTSGWCRRPTSTNVQALPHSSKYGSVPARLSRTTRYFTCARLRT